MIFRNAADNIGTGPSEKAKTPLAHQSKGHPFFDVYSRAELRSHRPTNMYCDAKICTMFKCRKKNQLACAPVTVRAYLGHVIFLCWRLSFSSSTISQQLPCCCNPVILKKVTLKHHDMQCYYTNDQCYYTVVLSNFV